MTIGERIKNKRIENGLSSTELANMVKVSKQSLYKYERGIVTHIPFDTVKALAKALHTTPAYLIGWEELDHNKIYIAEEINSPQLQTYKIQMYNDTDRNIFATDLPEDKYLLIGNGNVKELTPAEHTVLNNVLTAMESEDK